VKLDDDFEDAARGAILDDVEQQFREEIGPQLKELAAANWRAYASRHDYDIEFIPANAELFIERDGDSVTIRVEWPELTALFEWGVEPHTISGSPLHFYWAEQDQWIKTDEVDWGSETGGIPESRAIRDAMNEFRALLRS
jgi:hypothetical protein